MERKRTLRMIYPQWQGGVNPDYVFGSELLAWLAPDCGQDETVRIQVDTTFAHELQKVDGIDGGDVLLRQKKEVERILEEKKPERVIVFGGDCSVTQTPFDYLCGRYEGKIGILWLDAHPDISGPADSAHLHEMVLGNLLGRSMDSELTGVRHPLKPEKVFMAGLIEEDLRDMDQACKDLRLKIASPEELRQNSDSVLAWIRQEKLEYLAVHWDLDVLSPADFRSIYPAEPYLPAGSFQAAVGRMKLGEVSRLLRDVSAEAEMVGLSITEHLPWDARNFRRTLAEIPIFGISS